MRGTRTTWGEDLRADLDKLSGTFSLVVIGPGPVQVHPPSDIGSLKGALLEAHERWGKALTFHLFTPEVEYRLDHGAGQALAVTAEGPFELVAREYFLLADSHRNPGMQAFAALAPAGRVRVKEFRVDGYPVDLKIDELA